MFIKSPIKSIINFVFNITTCIFICSCNDMRDVDTPTNLPNNILETGKMYVLSEGLFNMNNSTLCFINFDKKTLKSDIFSFQNSRGLGDTGNDMKINGNKLWIVVNVSSQVEVVDLETGISIRRIPIFDELGKGRQPRFISFYENKAYVCSFDGTVSRIDINTFAVEKTIKSGQNPDGITVANAKLYVSNSGGLNMPTYDKTVSVINLATFTETKKIIVGLNPFKLETDSEGDIYLVSRGNNGNIKPLLQRIDSKTDEVIQSFDNLPVVNFTIHNDTAFLYHFDYITNNYWVKTFDCKTEKIISENFIVDNTEIERPFGITVHPTNGNVYITDALSYTVKGKLFCFKKDGTFNYEIDDIGLNPNNVILFK